MAFSIKNFFKYNPVTDANKTFNIEDALNKNWDLVNTMGQELDDEISVVNESLSQVSSIRIASGTGNAITLNTGALFNGYTTTFIASASNSGNATTINGIPLYKPNTTTAPTLISGKAYTVWYNSTTPCFFIKASAEGSAVAGDVLAGKTFSNDNDTAISGTLALSGNATIAQVLASSTFYNTDAKTKLTGTMVNNGAVSKTLNGGEEYTIPVGYHNGNGKVTALTPKNVETMSQYLESIRGLNISLYNASTNLITFDFDFTPYVPSGYMLSKLGSFCPYTSVNGTPSYNGSSSVSITTVQLGVNKFRITMTWYTGSNHVLTGFDLRAGTMFFKPIY